MSGFEAALFALSIFAIALAWIAWLEYVVARKRRTKDDPTAIPVILTTPTEDSLKLQRPLRAAAISTLAQAFPTYLLKPAFKSARN